MQPTIIGIIGKPLAGKDTVANVLSNRLPRVALVSMGEVVREVKATGPAHRFWDELNGAITIADAGGIAPDESIFRCLMKLVTEQFDSGNETVLWVGGPRSEQQLRWLDEWAKACGYAEKFIHVDVPDETVYERVEARASSNRTDDQAVSYRLTEFERVTKPVVDRLREQRRVIEVNGMGTKESIGSRAFEQLQPLRLQREITLPFMARR